MITDKDRDDAHRIRGKSGKGRRVIVKASRMMARIIGWTDAHQQILFELEFPDHHVEWKTRQEFSLSK